jgi:thiamine-phosphate pyrophosphorylase
MAQVKLPPIYPILDTESLARRDCPVERAAEAWMEAGAGILQIRHKGHWSRDFFQTARRIAEAARSCGAMLIVNDRADMAALLGAGLHVGQDDLAPPDARKVIGADAVLGFSSHNAEQLRAADAEPVTYVAFGPVFATASKLNPDPVVGLAQLRYVRGLTDKPLVAIGGITRERAGMVFAAGADAVAVIGDLLPDSCAVEALRERMDEWQLLGKRQAQDL